MPAYRYATPRSSLADPRTTEHYDRARGNLDRHGVHFLTAYAAGVHHAHFDAPDKPSAYGHRGWAPMRPPTVPLQERWGTTGLSMPMCGRCASAADSGPRRP
jgi:hypothetical protein